ncbi:MAG: hypothetical protein QGG40_05775 [Myxococcota bacterium]|nr:hypothetical protein [Myxococcota bacterium]
MDLTWKLAAGKLNETRLRTAGDTVAASYDGTSVRVEKEADDFVTFFFSVPWEENAEGGHADVEITVYDMGRDGLVLSLETDAGDNQEAWDDASQLAEDLADQLGGDPLDV